MCKYERETNRSEMDCFVCSHEICFNLKQCKAYYNMVHALFCLFKALISAMWLASLKLPLVLIKLWAFYAFTLITHSL